MVALAGEPSSEISETPPTGSPARDDAASIAPGADPHAERTWFDALATIARAVNQHSSERDVGDLVARACTRLAGFDRAGVLLADIEAGTLRVVGADGLTSDYVERVNGDRPIHLIDSTSALGRGPSSRAFNTGRPVIVNDITSDAAFTPWRDMGVDEGYLSMLAVPLVAATGRIGVMTCYREVIGIPRTSVDAAMMLAEHAALALETFQLRRHQEDVIAELTATLETLRRDRALHRELAALVLEGGTSDDVVDAVRGVVGDDVVFVPAGSPPPPSSVVVSVAGNIIGFLGMDRVLGPEERRNLESAATVIALEHQRATAIDEADARHARDLLGDILTSNELVDPAEFVDRARRAGYDLTTPHHVMVMRPDVPESAAPRQLAILARRLAPADAPPPLASYRNDTAVVLVPAVEAYENYSRSVHVAAQRGFGGRSCSTVIGGECSDLGSYSSAYRTVRAALDVRQQAKLTGSHARLEDLGALQFLLQVRRPDYLVGFSERLLSALTDEGGGRATNGLEDTLRAYLANRLSPSATAEALGVHANTVTNRLDRIARLTGRPLNDADHLLDLRLALMVRDVIAE